MFSGGNADIKSTKTVESVDAVAKERVESFNQSLSIEDWAADGGRGEVTTENLDVYVEGEDFGILKF